VSIKLILSRKRGRDTGRGEGSPPTSAKMSLDDEQIKLPKNEHETRVGEQGSGTKTKT